MNKTSRSVARIAITLSLALSLTGKAHACACCTEPGQRLDRSDLLSSYERGELGNLNFGPKASLFAGPGFPDDITGIRQPSDQPYNVKVWRNGSKLVFDLTSVDGKHGRLALPLPSRMKRLEIDPREETDAPPGMGPTLYKEWHIRNLARLGGEFAWGGSRAFATLILHGRGNSCTSADDFDHWTLEISGRKIRFTLLGTLTK